MSSPDDTPQKTRWFQRDWGHISDLVRTLKTILVRPEVVCRTYKDPRSHRYLGPVAIALAMLAVQVIVREGIQIPENEFDPEAGLMMASVEETPRPDAEDLLTVHSIRSTALGAVKICLTSAPPSAPVADTEGTSEDHAGVDMTVAEEGDPRYEPGNELACVWTVADRKGSAVAHMHYPSLNRSTTSIAVLDATSQLWSKAVPTKGIGARGYVLGMKWFEDLIYSEAWVMVSALTYGVMFAFLFRRKQLPFKAHVAFSLYTFAISFFLTTVFTLVIFPIHKLTGIGIGGTAAGFDWMAIIQLLIWLPYGIRRNYDTTTWTAIGATLFTMIGSLITAVFLGLGGSLLAAYAWSALSG